MWNKIGGRIHTFDKNDNEWYPCVFGKISIGFVHKHNLIKFKIAKSNETWTQVD